MDKWEFHSSPHIVYIDSDALEAQSESPGEETETEVSVTALEGFGVALMVGERCAGVPALLYQRIEMCTQIFKTESQRNMIGS